jgi:peptidoglycan hydrolase CwlO-like protein
VSLDFQERLRFLDTVGKVTRLLKPGIVRSEFAEQAEALAAGDNPDDRITELEEEVDSLNKEIKDLEAQVDTLETEKYKLEVQVEELKEKLKESEEGQDDDDETE